MDQETFDPRVADVAEQGPVVAVPPVWLKAGQQPLKQLHAGPPLWGVRVMSVCVCVYLQLT